MKINGTGDFGAWALACMVFILAVGDAIASNAFGVSAVGEVYRNRPNILLGGELLTPEVALSLRTHYPDGLNLFCSQPGSPDDLGHLISNSFPQVRWHAVVLNFRPRPGEMEQYETQIDQLLRKSRDLGVEVVWASLVGSDAVRENDSGRKVAARENFEVADLHAAFRIRPGALEDAQQMPKIVAATIAEPLRRTLMKHSTRPAILPVTEGRDPAFLSGDPLQLADPLKLPVARSVTRTIYRAASGEWQFNLHSFIAYHEGRYWAIWSTGRVDEDSSSQYLCYSTSRDGLIWTDPSPLAPDPDGEDGDWRWMASGIYVDEGRLFVLGTLNRGFGPSDDIWRETRLVRFEWRKGTWEEDAVIAENCAAYFPPLRVAGRDFLIWRDSRAHFFTALAPAGTSDWSVTRLPGPLPLYRMSETSVFEDPDGVLHLIIRDQGYTRHLYRSLSYDAGATWTNPVKTNYPDGTSKNMSGGSS
jgi:hypothetical protein